MDIPPRYRPEPDQFFAVCKERVNAYFLQTGHNRFANARFFFKAVVLLATYLLCYGLLLFAEVESLAVIGFLALGPLSVLIGINVAHDGAHGSVSKYRWVNQAALSLLDLLGASSYIWQKRHVHSHHHFPNVIENDADMKQNSMVRIFPNSEIKPAHRFQFLYAPVLYLFYTLNWLLYRDFSDFRESRIGSFKPGKTHRREFYRMIVFKTLYLILQILLPLLFSTLTTDALVLCWIGSNMLASMLITVALLPSHVGAHSEFPVPDSEGLLPYSWSHHQIRTVTDFATSSFLLNNLFGGFNHHIAHHLFPSICHVHYPQITPIIRATAREFGLPYQHEGNLVSAYTAHLRLLWHNGRTGLTLNEI